MTDAMCIMGMAVMSVRWAMVVETCTVAGMRVTIAVIMGLMVEGLMLTEVGTMGMRRVGAMMGDTVAREELLFVVTGIEGFMIKAGGEEEVALDMELA